MGWHNLLCYVSSRRRARTSFALYAVQDHL
ncbi:hypothetical protein ABH994_006302 [Bradyrhizobium yuanmingense]